MKCLHKKLKPLSKMEISRIEPRVSPIVLIGADNSSIKANIEKCVRVKIRKINPGEAER